MAGFKLSAFADEYSEKFTEQLEILNNLGIHYIEIRNVNGKNISALDMDDVEEVKAALKKYGIKVSSIGSPIGKIPIDEDFESHLNMAEKVFRYARELGSEYCRIFSFYLPDDADAEKYAPAVYDRLQKLLEVSKKYGITLCHENEAYIYGESPSKCKEIAEYFGGQIGCVFDAGNFVLDGYEPYPDAYSLLYEHIAYFHIKDALSAGAVVPPGKGEARIKDILDDFRSKSDKDIFITLEPHLQTFSGLNQLVGKAFNNPYKFKDAKSAFVAAYEAFKELL